MSTLILVFMQEMRFFLIIRSNEHCCVLLVCTSGTREYHCFDIDILVQIAQILLWLNKITHTHFEKNAMYPVFVLSEQRCNVQLIARNRLIS